MEREIEFENSSAENAQEVKPQKKKGKLEIAGYVMFAIAVIFFAICVWIAASASYGDDLGFGLYVVVMITFGFFSFYPAILFSLLSAIFTGLSIKRSKSAIVIFILSLVILILTLGYFLTSFIIATI